MWQLQLPAKIRIFAWKACLDRLPTRLNLAKRGVRVEAECPLCEKAMESTSHALIYCDELCEVWWNWQDCPINLLVGNTCLVDLALKILDVGSPRDLETLFATAWAIWFNRNQVVHEAKCSPHSQIWNLRCVLKRTTRMPYCIIMLSSRPEMLVGRHLLRKFIR